MLPSKNARRFRFHPTGSPAQFRSEGGCDKWDGVIKSAMTHMDLMLYIGKAKSPADTGQFEVPGDYLQVRNGAFRFRGCGQ